MAIRKNIKSYLGGKKTRRLRTKLRGGTKSKDRKALKKTVIGYTHIDVVPVKLLYLQ